MEVQLQWDSFPLKLGSSKFCIIDGDQIWYEAILYDLILNQIW